MLLVVSMIIYLMSVFPIIALFRIRQIPRYFCAFFIILIAEIILTGNILGVLEQLNNKGFWLFVQVIMLCISWIVWFSRKRPRLFSFQTQKLCWHELLTFQKFILIALGIVILTGYCILIYLILVVPPNNNDSMVVHLVRVGYWLQHGSFTPWDSFIQRQVIYPYNAQIVVLWSILFHLSDQFAAFLQFFSVLFTSLGIYCIAREIGGNRFQSALSGLFYLTFPQVILQATTTQDDLVITCFIVLGTYFFLRWYSKSFTNKNDLLLASISFMISIGIKPTAFYFFLGFIIFILILILFKTMRLKQLLQLGITCFVAFFILSSFSYINNLIHYHNPLGPPDFVHSESGVFVGNIFKKAAVNSGRFLYQFFSLDGLPAPIINNLQKAKISLAYKFPSVINTSMDFVKDSQKPFQLSTVPGINEDSSWFGPVSFLIILPGFIIGIKKSIRKNDLKILFLQIIPILMLIGIAVLRPGWDPYQGRYFNPGIALLMPLVIYLIIPKIRQRIYILLITLIAVVITISSVLFNESKPLITQLTIYKNFTSTACDENLIRKVNCYISSKLPRLLLDREDILSLNDLERMTYSSPGQYEMLSQVEKEIPENSRIGLILQNGDWEYPFFGRHFEYQLVPIINHLYLQDESWLSQNQIDYILVHQEEGQILFINPSYTVIDQTNDTQNNTIWKIYKR
jgi:4-amino-4-deoxy-L-arabinose transferase-like glycosyltransferase